LEEYGSFVKVPAIRLMPEKTCRV